MTKNSTVPSATAGCPATTCATRANHARASTMPEVHLEAHADRHARGHQQLPVCSYSVEVRDLLGGGRRRVEAVGQPLAREAAGQLDADDALAHGEHLRVVGEHAALDREAVVRGHGTDAGHLVRGDRDAEPGAADEQRAVGFALGDELGRRDRRCADRRCARRRPRRHRRPTRRRGSPRGRA